MTTEKTFVIECSMQDPKGILIPRGVIEQFHADIANEAAVWYFRDSRTTKRFVQVLLKLGNKETAYLDRVGKAITKYPGKTKEEIRDQVLKELKQLNLNAKVK